MAKIYHTNFENEKYTPKIMNTPKHTCFVILLAIHIILIFGLAKILSMPDENMQMFCVGISLLVYIFSMLALCITTIEYINPQKTKYKDKALYRNMLKFELLPDFDNMIFDTKKCNIIEFLEAEVNFSFEHNESFVNENIGISKDYIRGTLYDTYVYNPIIIPTEKIEKIAFRINPNNTYYEYYEDEIMVVYLKRGDVVAFFVASEKKEEREAYRAIKKILGDMIVGKYV